MKLSKKGLEKTKSFQKTTLKIKGMHCPSCEMLIADELEESNVKSKVNHKTGTAEIEFDESNISLEKIKQIIKKEGYQVE